MEVDLHPVELDQPSLDERPERLYAIDVQTVLGEALALFIFTILSLLRPLFLFIMMV